jgi:hypothetical protein
MNVRQALEEAIAIANVGREAVDDQVNVFLTGKKPNWKKTCQVVFDEIADKPERWQEALDEEVDLKALVDALKAANIKVYELAREEGTALTERFDELARTGGLVDQALKERHEARERLDDALETVLGVNAWRMCELLSGDYR